ncbi:histone acetyltransferase subunit NuA4-domain-containing protein [Massariosphaeria phaeospora]|uniref:Chromatin modification-related protein EAF6 n=1 Tax=Massariosphaeria phaeospora TaxID=100035 RepID=A0A7C8I2S6_9PLEO|nr:histone acetyltransferase subunit NuA4-domain-containing protein [Massariosphaeria phaeospora]
MAENAPPVGAANAASDASRGMPYYERLRRDLRESLQKKRVVDSNLAQLEESILKIETAYLEETSAGNIIKGFDNYIKGAATTTTTSGAGTATRRKAPISDADRIFSRSSSSFLREASTPGSTQTTPSHAPTPTSSFPTRESSQPTSNGTKKAATVTGSKNKKPTDDDDTESKPAKRGKITYGRD